MAPKPPERSKDVRAERLAAALKANLKRRKAQARGRSADAAGDRDAPPDTARGAPSEDPDR
jgi:hypothetical protein